ncbi:MAG: hypothetical protein EAZ89_06710 [Bacteroidetes bacterium]|nr:MAG: hypothetical protein EAZ89_06710 [Bacteroidota bacterium]
MKEHNGSFLLLLLTLYVSSLRAQAPGYLGKHTPIRIECSFFPALSPAIFQNEPLRLNVRSAVSAEHVINRMISAGGSIGYFSVQSPYSYNGTWGDIRNSGLTLAGYLTVYAFHRRGNMAPLGPFSRWELISTRYQLRDLSRRFYPDMRSHLGSRSELILALTLGEQRIFRDHLVWSYGIQLGWVLNAGKINGTEEEVYLYALSVQRLRGYFALNAHCAVGILLF